MLQAIAELTSARPHMRKSVHLGPAEFRTYSEGYYTGVIMALRVADLAVNRFKLATRTIAAHTRQRRSA